MTLLNKNTKTHPDVQFWFFLIISFGLFVFLTLRALYVPLTHDEIATFSQYVQRGSFLPFISKADGNNHLLNTSLTYVFYHLFGSSTLVLRLVNLLAAPFFFFFLIKLSKELSSKVLQWIFFVCISFSLHFIEFQALSRGYGLAITFFIGSCWQFIKAYKTSNIVNFRLSFLFIILSSLAILTFVYCYVLFAFLFTLRMLIKPIEKTVWRKAVTISLVYIPLVMILAYSFFLKSNGGYIEGRSDQFVRTTFGSLLMNMWDLGFKQADQALLIVFLLLIIPIVILVIKAFLAKAKELSSNYVFIYLLVGNSAITLVLSAMIHVNYPETRMAVYFYPLIIGSFIFNLDDLVKKTSKDSFALFALPLLYLPIHFVQNLNIEYSVWYKYCHIPNRFYDRIMGEYKSGEYPPTVGGHGVHAYAWSALVKEHNGICNLMETSQFPSYNTRYEIIELQNFQYWQSNYDTIDYDKISNLHLLRKKHVDKRLLYAEIDSLNTSNPCSDEFFGIYQHDISSLRGKMVEVNFDFSLKSIEMPIYGMVVVSIGDSLHNNLVYNNIQLNMIKDNWDGSQHNFLKTAIFLVPEKSSEIQISLWNIAKSKFILANGKVELNVLMPE